MWVNSVDIEAIIDLIKTTQGRICNLIKLYFLRFSELDLSIAPLNAHKVEL